MRIHLAFAFYVILAGAVCGIAPLEWCAALLCIALVIALECVNTAIEVTGDAIGRKFSYLIGLAKDLAAGAVLVAAVISAVIGGIIFFNAPCIDRTLEFIQKYPAGAAAIVLTVPLWIKFITMRRLKPCRTSQNPQ